MTIGSIIIKANPVTAWENRAYCAYRRDSTGYVDLAFDSVQPDERAEAGDWGLTFRLYSRINILKEIFENGLDRHVEAWDSSLECTFEGTIDEMILNTPPDSYSVSMDGVVNKSFMRADVDGDNTVERSTTLTNSDSQDRFGTITRVIAGAEVEGLTVADQAIQTALDLSGFPNPEGDFGGGSGEQYLEVFCRGYWHTLQRDVYNQTSETGTQGLSAQISDIIGNRASVKIIQPSTWDSTMDWDEGDTSDADNVVASADDAASFDDANSEYLDIADNADLSFGDEDFSITGWFLVDDLGSDYYHLSKWDSSTDNREYGIVKTGGDEFRFIVSDTGGSGSATFVDASTFGSISSGTWYFVYAYHDSVNNELGISVNDGTVDTQAYSSGVFDGSAAFMLGARDQGSVNNLDGGDDEVAVWGAVKPSSDVTDIYNGGLGVSYSNLPNTTDLIAYWSLNEASGTRSDSQGSNDLSDNNTVTSRTGAVSSTSVEATTASAREGSHGLEIGIANQNAGYVEDQFPTNETEQTTEFWVDPSGLTMATDDEFHLCTLREDGGGVDAARIVHKYDGTDYLLYTQTRTDGGSYADGSETKINALYRNLVRLVTVFSSGAGNDDGRTVLFVNNQWRDEVDGVDNDTLNVDTVRYGAVSGLDSGTSGTLKMDTNRISDDSVVTVTSESGSAEFIASKDIDANATTVTKELDSDREPAAIIRSMASLGDSSNNRWVPYIEPRRITNNVGRRFRFAQASPADVQADV